MSVLRDRIVAYGAIDQSPAAFHPAGTPDTPMVMPMSEITYSGDTALYGTLHPLVTADGATIPARPVVQGTWAQPAPVAPAGRP